MSKKVIKRFQDKETKEVYFRGDLYENDNSDRVAFLVEKGYLASADVQEGAEFPKHTGGGWYELSNGEKVKGKKEASATEKDLQKSGE
ncbi:hypothetical protein LC048_13590 [Mesobacillus subterraneus]|uniref:hypothetical protein n=1 Tax=Mesobacillus subterraneus TaxID=285983 RepID=UPI001CFC5B07|nr:hypothetical protein [Mesobacillus subterraneus]WLR53556.1 hypothetical protein LC048_13590 [Mesobacillus subterraneus]